MSAKIRIPYCIVCGKLGVDLGKVSGKDVAICPDCAKALLPRLQALVAELAPPKPKPVKKISVKELKELIAEKVEKRGRLSLYDLARRYGHSRATIREIAKTLAEERGWEVEEAAKKLVLKKPAPAEVAG